MKSFKVCSIVLLFCILSQPLYAQFEMGKWYLEPKVSFAEFAQDKNWKGYSSDCIPPFQVEVDYGLSRYLSVGVLAGFARNKYTNDTLRSNVHLDYRLAFGTVAAYHFAEPLERLFNYSWDLSNFDLYLALGARLEYAHDGTTEAWNEATQTRLSTSNTSWKFQGGPSLGARYYLNKTFAMSIEAGWSDLGKVSMGLSWKLN